MLPQRLVAIDPANPSEAIVDTASKLLHEGRIIVYPTDTTYALGVNALDASAILRLFELKGRPTDKPIHVVVANLEMAEDFVVLDAAAHSLAKKFLPGPLTLILPKKVTVPDILVGGRKTLGIRVPDNPVCSMLARKAAIPFTTTSANVSGEKPAHTVEEVVKQFNSRVNQPDLFLNQGPLPNQLPSTVVDLTTFPPSILREGPISHSQILEALVT